LLLFFREGHDAENVSIRGRGAGRRTCWRFRLGRRDLWGNLSFG
jgi:hypothetical protein